MKKLIACLLTLTMLVGIVPAVLGAEAAQPKSIKVLSIGEEFSRSAFDYMYKVFEAEGYSDISVAYLISSTGHNTSSNVSSITYYAKYLKNSQAYSFCNNVRDFADDIASSYSMEMALEANDWDYIVLNTTPIQSGDFDTFSTALDKVINYIKQCSDAKIGWHMNWAYQEGYQGIASNLGTIREYDQKEAESFKLDYKGNPVQMYEAIVSATRQVANKVDFVVPVGTAVMNMKSSYLNDLQVDQGDYFVDGSNLNELGKLVASYTWYAALTENTLTDLNFDDAFLVDLSAADRKVVVEAINNAVKTPYQQTASSYQTELKHYNAVVNGATTRHLPDETVTISTKAALNGGRKFLYWRAVDGGVTFDNSTARTTTFTMPARDVKVEAVYEAEVPGQLKVGFKRVDVTPSEQDLEKNHVALSGYGNGSDRHTTGTHENDGITITAVAISDGTNTNVITTMDFLYAPEGWIEKARERLVEERILDNGMDLIYSATHTHSGPSIGAGTALDKGGDGWYYTKWMNGMVGAVTQALADLRPVSETKISITEVPGMNTNRHYRNSEGGVSGANFERPDRGTFRDSDKSMQLIRFVREDAQDILLVNSQGHPVHNSSNRGPSEKNPTGEDIYYQMSADYPGAMRRYVETVDKDCQVAFFLGASGNLAPYSNLNEVRARWRNGYPTYSLLTNGDAQGEMMGKYIIEMMKNMTTVETGAVRSMHQDAVIFYKHYDGFLTRKQEAVSIGSSIAFVTAPYEMFDGNGIDIKETSPFDITFVLTCSDGPNGNYIPEWQTFFYPYLPGNPVAYEANPDSDWGVFHTVPGAGEDLADGLIAMLNKLYNN